MPAIQLMTVSGTDTVQGTDTSSVKPQKLQGLQSAFSNYMRQNSSNLTQTAQQTAVPKAAETKTAAAPDSSGSVQQQYEQYQGKAAAQADRVGSTGSAETTDMDAVNEAVEEAVEDIKEILKENLDVDDEQIEAAMEILGLTQADLLDPQQLTALAAELTGSEDTGMMLFHENFQQVLQETTAVTEDLLNDLGMTMDELMMKISKEINTDTEVQPQATADFTQTFTSAEVQPQEAAVQPAGQTVQTAQEVPAETAERAVETAAPQQEAAVQVQKADRTQEAQPKNVQPQEEVQPEKKQVQEAQPQQEQSQTDGEETAENDILAKTGLTQDHETQENHHFDLTAQVHHQEPSVHAQAPQEAPSQAPAPEVSVPEVIDQIVEYTKVSLSQDVKSIEMQLNPENLGKVYLHVSEKQGTVTAQLTAQNENIKEALVQQAAVLKESLNQQGIKVDAVEVSAGTHEFESNLERDAHSQEEQARQQEEQNERRSRRSIDLSGLDGTSDIEGLSGLMTEEERLVAQIMRDNGNNVDYKA